MNAPQTPAHTSKRSWNYFGVVGLLIVLFGSSYAEYSRDTGETDARTAAIAALFVMPAIGLVACTFAVIFGYRRRMRGNWLPIVGIALVILRMVSLLFFILALNKAH